MSTQFLTCRNQALDLYFIVFRPERSMVAAFADPTDAIDYVLRQFETYGFVPNDDLTITNCSGRPILSVMNTASLDDPRYHDSCAQSYEAEANRREAADFQLLCDDIPF